MGLADFIQQKNIENPAITQPTVKDGHVSLVKNKPVQKLARQTKQQSQHKQEKLKFLRPCPLCQGRYFTYGQKGGFYCETCQPGIAGSPVYATGKERRKIQAVGSIKIQAQSQKYPAQTRKGKSEKECFKIGFPWIMEHLKELLACGWTKPELFSRSRHKWCVGDWGVAWLPIWARQKVDIKIQSTGAIHFIFKSGGRIVTQSAYPEKKVSIPQQTHS